MCGPCFLPGLRLGRSFVVGSCVSDKLIHDSRESLVSTPHLSVGVLELQMCANTSGLTWGLEIHTQVVRLAFWALCP